MDYITPTLVGVYSAGGLYVARYIKGSSQELSITVLGTAALIGAASAVAAPQISNKLVCPHSPGAPLCEAGTSAAVAWAAVLALNNMESANMFVPVQLGSHLLALVVAPYIRAYTDKADAKKADAKAKKDWDLSSLMSVI